MTHLILGLIMSLTMAVWMIKSRLYYLTNPRSINLEDKAIGFRMNWLSIVACVGAFW